MKSSSHRPVFWSIAGLLLLAIAGWEAVQVTRGGRKAFDALLPPPLRSRSGERPSAVRETQTGDPVANYLARAKRGMTEQEVRWMLEDFEAVGLDQAEAQLRDFDAAKAQRKKLEAWYLSALSEGLSLTASQMEEAKAKLDFKFTRDLQELERLKESASEIQHRSPATLCSEDLSEAYRLFYEFPATMFFDSTFAPWNLLHLTENQTSLTLRFWRLEDWKRKNEHDPFFGSGDDAEPDDWLYTAKGRETDPFADSNQATVRDVSEVPALQDPSTGNLTEFPGDPPLILATPEDRRLYAYLPCGNLLPLTPDQKPLWEKSYDLAAQALLCHPAQLRLALLQQPELAKILREQLDLEPSQRGLKLPPQDAAPVSSE